MKPVFVAARTDEGDVLCVAGCGSHVVMTDKARAVVIAGGVVCCGPCATRLAREHPEAWVKAESTN